MDELTIIYEVEFRFYLEGTPLLPGVIWAQES